MRVNANDDYEPLLYPDYQPVRYGLRADANGETGYLRLRGTWLVVLQPVRRLRNLRPFPTRRGRMLPETMRVHSRFGYFRTERFIYDRENIATLSALEQLANRWNIWEKSFGEDGEAFLPERTVKPSSTT